MGNLSTKEAPAAMDGGVAMASARDATAVVHAHAASEKTAASSQRAFRVLAPNQKAISFDERLHLSKAPRASLPTKLGGFRPLQRAATYDSRLRVQRNSLTLSDVLHRRHFNQREKRQEPDRTRNLYRIPEAEVDEAKPPEAIVVVDPFSTGIVLTEQALDRGFECIAVHSDTLEVMKPLISHIPKTLIDRCRAVIFHDGGKEDKDEAFESTVAAIEQVHGVKIVAVMPGAETGVNLADRLSERMGLRTNKTAGSEARRNKYQMGEKVRAAGLRAVKQCMATKWSQIVQFIEEDLKPVPFQVIVKPVESAGSDDVTLCHSMEEVKQAFGNIQGKINGLGVENAATLVQEYLEGTEYVVDTVSRDGKHKVVAVWEYDKRAANGAPFVYYGVILRAADGPILTPVVDYILKVLDALEIRNGPGHAEVKFVRGEPCLVEIGARCHGGEGTIFCISNRCIGYDQAKVTLDAFFDEDAFDAIPDRPRTVKGYGCEAMLVSYKSGILEEYSGFEEAKTMASYISAIPHLPVHEELAITIDMFTSPASIMLFHTDEKQLEADYCRIRELEHNGMYKLREVVPEITPEPKKVVVVVDPFSTGAIVAHSLMSRGIECICVYSDRLDKIEHLASLVPEGLTLSFAATIAYEGNLDKTAAAIKKAATDVLGKQRQSQKCCITAVLAGAELGVRLADALTDSFGLDGNVISQSEARRNKFLMGETLRSHGVRAVQQCKASTWERAKQFITEELKPSPFEVVIKPLESAGTEDVVLCFSLEEAEQVFHSIVGKTNQLGIDNDAVLLQEYLDGDEYVVDTVSRNGKHKTMAIWKYDKRRVNDAAFVYFGLSLIPADGIINQLIEYQYQVLDALGIRNGPAHGEVKLCHGSPTLIEVGSRCHGGEGAWIPIADKCVGYNQVDATIDSVLDPGAFARLPERPSHLHAYGCEAMLVSYQSGMLKSLPGLAEIEQMRSFMQEEIFVHPGDMVNRTIDMFTTPGSIILTHADQAVLEADLVRIRELEREGLYEFV